MSECVRQSPRGHDGRSEGVSATAERRVNAHKALESSALRTRPFSSALVHTHTPRAAREGGTVVDRLSPVEHLSPVATAGPPTAPPPLGAFDQTEAARVRIRDGIHRVAAAVGASTSTELVVTYEDGYPSTVNAAAQTAFAADAAAEVVGEANVLRDREPPTMGAEDFSYMLQARRRFSLFVSSPPFRFGSRFSRARAGLSPLSSSRSRQRSAPRRRRRFAADASVDPWCSVLRRRAWHLARPCSRARSSLFQRRPGAYLWLGSASTHALHHPKCVGTRYFRVLGLA